MAYIVVMPRLGQTMEFGEIVEWSKNEGEAIKEGEVLLIVQSDKANLEVESDCSGVLAKILATADDGEIPCFEPIAIIAASGETVDVDQLLVDFRAKQGA